MFAETDVADDTRELTACGCVLLVVGAAGGVRIAKSA
jgi:hypothetical protein